VCLLQGFKIGILLKLEDIKATDRTTTLLQFCVGQAADQSDTVLSMAAQLPHVRPAAKLHVTAIDTLLGELATGIAAAQKQVVAACSGAGAADGEDGSVRLAGCAGGAHAVLGLRPSAIRTCFGLERACPARGHPPL
jgi:Formin Homology 2 Domain